ncbi:M23 family metallopeptidase [Emcibacter sp.]|uniref:M23 family metallopeptidase n=1 Tax=Emcibacter sp. TaxID=1979954 RepID=UPI002AA65866|nr:M23 family metallopeptidase [Emcibacter sp.]
MIDTRLKSIFFITGSIFASLLLAACQEGHPYQMGYKNSPPSWTEKNTPYPIPEPRSKPKAPQRFVAIPENTPDVQVNLSGKTAKVRKGDTVYAISRRYGVTVRQLISHNRLKAPYLLRPGQQLALPVAGHHIVRKGDTVYSISRHYRVDMTELARLNKLQKPYMLRVGQKLNVPGNGATGSNPIKIAIPSPPPTSGQGFLWPVSGRVISGFGPKSLGLHNDGINIAARYGETVRAAEAGVVVHADSRLKGYGGLILIQHEGGWMTAYAHNSRILVKKGQKISRGQAIAEVGKSGRVTSPQLHFELRKGNQAVNPEKYLKI